MSLLKDTMMKYELPTDFWDYSEFKYWFNQIGKSKFHVIDKNVHVVVGIINHTKLTPNKGYEVFAEQMSADFVKFRNRPEAQIGRLKLIVRDELGLSDSQVYELKLIGCILHSENNINSCHADVDNRQDIADRITACIDWLQLTDFYTAPASTMYHESFTGGLLEHTLNVVDQISELIWINKFLGVKLSDAVLVALVHDWCKIGYYEPYTKNVKNAQGQWEVQTAFKVSSNPLTCYGHGVSSMAIAMRFFSLTDEQQLAIRWHMGEYNVAPNEMNELHNANSKIKLCYLIQFADRLACTEY